MEDFGAMMMVILVLLSLLIIITYVDKGTEAFSLEAECEKKLVRTQYCKLIAVPEEK